MNVTNWFSPVQIIDSKILGVQLNIEEDFSGGETLFSLTLNSSLGKPELRENNYFSQCTLEAVGNWTTSNEDEKPAFSASCKLGILIAVPEVALGDIPPSDRETFVLANAISIAYGKIRAVIESVTSESIVGKKTIPAVDPYSLLESIEATKEANQQ